MQAREIGFDSRLDLDLSSRRHAFSGRKSRDLTHGGSFVVPFSDRVYDLGNKKKPEVAFPHTPPLPQVTHLVYNGVTLREQRERERKEYGWKRKRKRDRRISLLLLMFR